MQISHERVAAALLNPGRLPRHAEILEAIIRTTEPDTGELLTHSLMHAPRNRAQAREQVRQMPKAMRRRYGQGWDRNVIGFAR